MPPAHLAVVLVIVLGLAAAGCVVPSPEPATTTTTTAPTGTADGPLLIGLSVHVEGWRSEVRDQGQKQHDTAQQALGHYWLARMLHQRGEPKEALSEAQKAERIYRSQSEAGRAMLARTMGQIADIYQARGQLDEALRIRNEEQLPVFEKLGDIRSRAVTMGQIADIYQARGQLDEALRIRKEEELPVYEKLKARRDILVCEANIAILLLQRKKPGDRSEAERLLRKAHAAAVGMQLPEAKVIESILAKLAPSAAPGPPRQANP